MYTIDDITNAVLKITKHRLDLNNLYYSCNKETFELLKNNGYIKYKNNIPYYKPLNLKIIYDNNIDEILNKIQRR